MRASLVFSNTYTGTYQPGTVIFRQPIALYTEVAALQRSIACDVLVLYMLVLYGAKADSEEWLLYTMTILEESHCTHTHTTCIYHMTVVY